MNKVNDISEELKSMGSILADMPRTMPYSVPVGYFENFTGALHTTIKDINTPEQLPGWSKTMPYAVPDGYFNKLAGDILAAATAADRMSALPKDIPFKTPVGYFESLPAQILSAAKAAGVQTKKPQTIPLTRGFIFRQLRWAAAAVVFLSIGIGSYQVFYNTPSDNPETMLASVPNNDIHDYLQHIYNKVDIDRIVSNTEINNLKLDNKDIVQYLNETGWE